MSERAGYTPEEWRTLQFAPFWIFSAVIGAYDRFDPRDYRAFVHCLEAATMAEGRLGREVLASVVADRERLARQFRGERRSIGVGLFHVDAVLRRAGDDEADLFKARPSSLAPEGLQDPQMVMLETADGILVDVESFVTCQFGYDIRYELVGETGTLALGEHAGVQVRGEGGYHGPIPADYRERFGAAYQRELQEWVTGVLRGQVTGPSAWDGYATTAVAEAAVQSLTDGRRTTVELADRPALYA